MAGFFSASGSAMASKAAITSMVSSTSGKYSFKNSKDQPPTDPSGFLKRQSPLEFRTSLDKSHRPALSNPGFFEETTPDSKRATSVHGVSQTGEMQHC